METANNTKPKILIAALLGLTLAAVLTTISHYGIFAVPHAVLLVARWFAIACLIGYAISRRSLTTWILVSMIIGAEIGNDWPGFAVNLRLLSQIFLRLIKTIIAPL